MSESLAQNVDTCVGAQTALELLPGDPPASVKHLVNQLFAGSLVEPRESVMQDQIPQDVLRVLNEYAAMVANTEDCEIVAIHDCHTCYVSGAPGRLLRTNGRMQCWLC